MKDKFFSTVRDRFDVHRSAISQNLEYLEYLHYDHLSDLSPDFKVQIDACKDALKRMDDLISELETK
jgi:predicted DNA-binding protein YlxM (UPF0122 family)